MGLIKLIALIVLVVVCIKLWKVKITWQLIVKGIVILAILGGIIFLYAWGLSRQSH